MKLEHSFTIPVPVDEAWPVLLDIQRIAPCMPGASVDSVEGDDFTGSVKVKLGPINLTYKGQAKFIEKDDKAHKAVIDARGRDSRGNGTAAAKITAQLTEKGSDTECQVTTDLNITGKPAQFGRGVMVDVGNKLIGQFADCLSDKLAGGSSDSSSSAGSASSTGSASADNKAGGADKSSTGAAGTAVGAAGAAGAKTASGAEDKTPTGSVTVSGAEQAADRDSASAQKATSPSSNAAASSAPAKPSTPTTADASSQARHAADDAEPIDLLELAGGSVAKRAVPAAAGLAILIAIIVAITGRKKK